MNLAPNYDYGIADAEGGLLIKLIERATGKEVRFFCAGSQDEARIARLSSHMESLTDDLCRDHWFKEVLTPEQRKAKQKAEKEAKRQQREAEEAAALAKEAQDGASQS